MSSLPPLESEVLLSFHLRTSTCMESCLGFFSVDYFSYEYKLLWLFMGHVNTCFYGLLFGHVNVYDICDDILEYLFLEGMLNKVSVVFLEDMLKFVFLDMQT